MSTVFNIGLHHFLFVSIILVGAGVATILTKRNAIGILIGVELILNAAGVNLVAFNRYSHPERTVRYEVTEAQVAQVAQLRLTDKAASDETLLLAVVRRDNPDALAIERLPAASPVAEVTHEVVADESAATASAAASTLSPGTIYVRYRAADGLMFAVFIIVLAAAEAAVALAIFLNYYNNFSSIDVEKGAELKG